MSDMKPIPYGAIRDVKEVDEVSVESMAGAADLHLQYWCGKYNQAGQ